MGSETVVRRRPGGVDSLGDPKPDLEPPATYQGCAVYPRGSSEDAGRSATVVVGYTALIPDTNADILPGDLLTWRGKEYDVEGEPGLWTFLDGTAAALQVALKRAAN